MSLHLGRQFRHYIRVLQFLCNTRLHYSLQYDNYFLVNNINHVSCSNTYKDLGDDNFKLQLKIAEAAITLIKVKYVR